MSKIQTTFNPDEFINNKPNLTTDQLDTVLNDSNTTKYNYNKRKRILKTKSIFGSIDPWTSNTYQIQPINTRY